MAPKEKRGRPESKSRMMSVIKKKKQTLMKKADELSILCGVEACVICLSSETNECDVWSSTPDALYLVKRYRELKTEDKSKRKVDLTDLMRQRIDEVKKKLEIQRKKNLELELQNKLSELKNLSADGLPLQSLQKNLSLIDKTLEKVRERMSTLRKVAIGSVPQAYDTLCSSLSSSDPQNIQLDYPQSFNPQSCFLQLSDIHSLFPREYPQNPLNSMTFTQNSYISDISSFSSSASLPNYESGLPSYENGLPNYDALSSVVPSLEDAEVVPFYFPPCDFQYLSPSAGQPESNSLLIYPEDDFHYESYSSPSTQHMDSYFSTPFSLENFVSLGNGFRHFFTSPM